MVSSMAATASAVVTASTSTPRIRTARAKSAGHLAGPRLEHRFQVLDRDPVDASRSATGHRPADARARTTVDVSLNSAMVGAVRSPPPSRGRPEDAYRRRPHRNREVHRPAVVADDS